jgi:hypothetical protein
MKTLLSLLTVAVPAAFFLSPIRFEVAASGLFAAGLVLVALYDYTRTFHPVVAAPAARGAVKRHRERLRLAA